MTADSDLVGGVPTLLDGSTEFFGFVADGSFTTVTFDSADGNNDGFATDNFVYVSSSTPVPFEVSPTLGLLTIGGIWSVSRLRKKRRLTK